MYSFIKKLIKLISLLFFLCTVTLNAQDLNANSPKPNQGSRQQQLADKKKEKQQKKIAKGVEQGKKRHEKIQQKKTRKMMKKSKRKSKRWNENKKEPFYKRWFD